MFDAAMVAHPSLFDSPEPSHVRSTSSVIARSVSYSAAQKGHDYFAEGRVIVSA